jgi:hypothetical protein
MAADSRGQQAHPSPVEPSRAQPSQAKPSWSEPPLNNEGGGSIGRVFGSSRVFEEACFRKACLGEAFLEEACLEEASLEEWGPGSGKVRACRWLLAQRL